MASVVVTSVVELLISTVKQLIQHEIELVRGVDKELLDLSDKLNKVRDVLEDADMKQFKEKTVRDWLLRLEQASYEMEDVLEEWNYAIIQHTQTESGSESASPPKHKVCSFLPSSCFCFKKIVFRHDIAKKVQNLKWELDEILSEKDVYNLVISQPKTDPSSTSWRLQSTSLIDSAQVQGREEDKNILASKLMAAHHDGSGYQVISIVGAGGLGKTTLAQLVYNDSRVEQCFDFTIWVCVSDPFDVWGIAKEIITVINKESPPDTNQLDTLLKNLIHCISCKRILLVLDDVWDEQGDKWQPLKDALKHGGAGSKILVTTRKERVALIMGTIKEDIHHLKVLMEEDCHLLLMRASGRSEEKFEKFHEIGEEIAKKCNGLPLAAKTLGSLLLFKKTIQEWEEVLESEMWELKQVELELFPHLLLSYHELSPKVKRCFSYCAFFPKDKKLEVKELIRIWMALGYLGSNIGTIGEDMELKGREIFEDLAMRSLFQDFERDDSTEQISSCKMHDIVHDFAKLLRKNCRVEDSRITKGTCQVCDPSLLSIVQEYRSLIWEKNSPLNLCDCLISLRALEYCGRLNLQGMEKLIHLRKLDISFSKLSKEHLETICKLYFLQTLSLTNCFLKELPREIENLVHLRHLDLSWNQGLKELPENMYSLVELRTLLLLACSLNEISAEIGNLIQLRHLTLSYNRKLKKIPESICSLLKLQTLLLSMCSLEEIPEKIGNLVHLRHLDLSLNRELKELPESMYSLVELHTLSLSYSSVKEISEEVGNLIHLRHLDLSWNIELKELPDSIGSLVELQTLNIDFCLNLRGLPQTLAQLSGLTSLNGFIGGSGCNNFGLLKNLNNLSESFKLFILVGSSSSIDMKELVEDAQGGELRKKIRLQKLEIRFIEEKDEEEHSSSSSSSSSSLSSLWVDVIEALEPHQNLQFLKMLSYIGSRLPHWISSPLNLVREIRLSNCNKISSLPAMGKLPFLEVLKLSKMKELKVVGVEWLGIRGREGEIVTNTQSSSSIVAFPKLKLLKFKDCPKWSEWEDITAEEEESAAVSVMPCLTHLRLWDLQDLKMLPHGILRKASSLLVLEIETSPYLLQSYQHGSSLRSLRSKFTSYN